MSRRRTRPAAPAAPGPPRVMLGARADWGGTVGVAIVAALVFLPALQNEFVSWDDDTNFLSNPNYRGLGIAQLTWMVTTLHGHYIPLTWLTLGLDYALWGMSPRGYHLTSVLLHAIAAGLVYRLAYRLLGSVEQVGDPPTRSGLGLASSLTALLFAIHPLRVESVAWVTERRDVLCGVFYLLALLAYLRYIDTPESERPRRRRWYWASCGAFALALMSKPIAVTLPLSLLLLDVYPLRRVAIAPTAPPGPRRPPSRALVRQVSRLVIEKIPFLLLSAGAAALALFAMGQSSSLSTTAALGAVERAAIAFHSVAFYLAKLVWPVALSPLYELPFSLDPLAPRFLASAAATVSITALAWILRERFPAVLAAWAAYLIALLPVLGVVQYGPHIAADRNTYLASVPLATAAGAAFLWLWRQPAPRRLFARATLVTAAAALLVILSALTWRQTAVWRDSETLWARVLAVGPSAIAHSKLGIIRDEQGQLVEALSHFRMALDIQPGLPPAHNNWGIALARRGQWADAISHYEAALRTTPDYLEAHLNLAIALDRVGRTAEAQRHFQAARQLAQRSR
jgi:tetratricopeptide (TPR) repeat protein